MRDYPSWSFFNRPFLAALTLSGLWHLLWILTLNVTIQPPYTASRPRPEVVSLGPVLDDTIFRTLVEARPRYSEAFYRHLSDLSRTIEPEVQTTQRRQPGDVVSFVMGQRLFDSLRQAVGGSKFEREPAPASSAAGPEITGEAAGRKLLYRPSEPEPDDSLPAQLRHPIEIVFDVGPGGAVVEAQIVSSSGEAESDLLYLAYLKQWRFNPIGAAGAQRGRVRFELRESGGGS